MLERVAVVMPLHVPRRTNFTQRSTSMWALRSATNPARRPASWNRTNRSETRPSGSPNTSRSAVRVRDVPGLVDHGHDVGHTAGNVAGARMPRHHVHRLDAVLERDHHRVRADERGEPRGRAVHVVQLHREQHHVHRADRGRIVGGTHGQVQIALRAGDSEAALLQGGKVRAACNEGDVGARVEQASPEVAAHGAGAKDCDAHIEFDVGNRESGTGSRESQAKSGLSAEALAKADAGKSELDRVQAHDRLVAQHGGAMHRTARHLHPVAWAENGQVTAHDQTEAARHSPHRVLSTPCV